MLKIGDKVAKIDKKTNEVVNIFEINSFNSIHKELRKLAYGRSELDVCMINLDTYSDKYFIYEPLTKDHEQRYQNFLYKQTVTEWFENKEFSFEEKEAIYNSFNVILATENDRKLFFDTIENPRELNEALKKAYKNRNKFFED